MRIAAASIGSDYSLISLEEGQGEGCGGRVWVLAGAVKWKSDDGRSISPEILASAAPPLGTARSYRPCG
jgi:hypothetical protein